ncbi:MAG: biopolymer transporter ExbD [Nitrospinae bacterium]|nr:biopolymer transporter ExbD [Nitrospinota bacterium]
MASSNFNTRRGVHGQMADINVVPLVDVMLVLLVIFIITTPLLTHAVKIDLPKTASAPNVTRAERIELGLREDGAVFWNGEQVALDTIGARFAQEAARAPQPELHIHADRHTHYERVARAMALAAGAGITRIGFVTNPEEG